VVALLDDVDAHELAEYLEHSLMLKLVDLLLQGEAELFVAPALLQQPREFLHLHLLVGE